MKTGVPMYVGLIKRRLYAEVRWFFGDKLNFLTKRLSIFCLRQIKIGNRHMGTFIN